MKNFVTEGSKVWKNIRRSASLF